MYLPIVLVRGLQRITRTEQTTHTNLDSTGTAFPRVEQPGSVWLSTRQYTRIGWLLWTGHPVAFPRTVLRVTRLFPNGVQQGVEAYLFDAVSPKIKLRQGREATHVFHRSAAEKAMRLYWMNGSEEDMYTSPA